METEVLKVEYDAEYAVRDAEALRTKLAEVTSVVNAQAAAFGVDGKSIELVAETYDVLPARVDAVRVAVTNLTKAEETLLADIRAENILDAETVGILNARAAAMGKLENNTAIASATTQKYARSLKDTGAAAGRGGAASGLLLLSQVIDDAQYGFQAIVNQMPQVGMAIGNAFGASAETSMKLGGALGLIGVAINTNIKRLDEWKILLEDIAGKEFVQGLIDQWKSLAIVANMAAREAQKAAEENRQAAAKTALATIEGITDEAQQDRALAMRKAIQESGGGKEVLQQLIAADARAGQRRTPELQKKFEENLAISLASATKGEQAGVTDIVTRLGGEGGAFGQRIERNTAAYKARVKAIEDAHKKADEERAQQAEDDAQAAEQEAKDEEAYTEADQRESDRRLAARKAAAKRRTEANETKVNRDLEEDKKDLEKALKPFESQAEMAVLQGARGQFAGPRQRDAFQRQAAADIRQQARANLIAQGVDPDEAGALAQRAPQQVSENLQRKNLALQAQGFNEQQRTQALVSLLIGDMARVEGQVHAVRGGNDALIRQRQQVARTAQNRARN